ncbi:hypothetical protein GF380_03845 [Candidatus Uhrbacteria bacterium]|nr:hypothetical protein [Candidatus Uhrbacteria bacterium]MBD3284226.1 hypothetical protein [Candidatus Uhrbacteria bacterium]
MSRKQGSILNTGSPGRKRQHLPERYGEGSSFGNSLTRTRQTVRSCAFVQPKPEYYCTCIGSQPTESAGSAPSMPLWTMRVLTNCVETTGEFPNGFPPMSASYE